MPKNIDLILKGFAVGSADVVPGVSGGTMALILGIYDRLLSAILSVNKKSILLLLTFRWKKAFDVIEWKFILPLSIGIVGALIVMSRVLVYLISHFHAYTWSVFFGFVLSSALVLFHKINGKKRIDYIAFFIGAALGYALVGFSPATAPNTRLYLMFAGILAICAMILPGISGAYILILLGKYQDVIGYVRNPFLPEHILNLFILATGCLIGLFSFSRILKWTLDRWSRVVIALMSGLMIGSLRKIWPWKETPGNGNGGHAKHVTGNNVIPEQLDFDVVVSIGLFVAAMILGGILTLRNKSNATL